MVFTSPIFAHASPFGAHHATPLGVSPVSQIHQIQAIKQLVISKAFQSLNATEQLAIQQIQHPNPIVLQQLVPIIEQHKQHAKQAIQHLVQIKLQLLAEGVHHVQTPAHRHHVEQAVQRLVQLAQIKHQIRQLFNEAKNSANPQLIHDNFKQVLELSQLAKLVLAQVQLSQYNEINFGNWAQTSIFSVNPFTSSFNSHGHHGLFGQTPSTLAYQSAFGGAHHYHPTGGLGHSPIFGQHTHFY
jgi:hypothetical protein